MTTMTKGEREELKRLARERARVAKADAERRTADLKALFEASLSDYFSYDRDEVWNAVTDSTREIVTKAQQELEERCDELGVPRRFAPQITATWSGHGKSMVLAGQMQARREAYKRLDAMERTAKHEVDRRALEIQTQLVAEGLTSARAIEFLSTMPDVEALMPEISASDLLDGDDDAPPRELGPGDDPW